MYKGDVKTRVAAMALLCLALLACGGKSGKGAEELLRRAQEQYEGGAYTDALSTIDSLRKTFPKEIEVRKKALRLYQEVELTRAEKELAIADSALVAANSEYDRMKAFVDGLRGENKAGAEQLSSLTRMKMKRDSLQTNFDVLCAKIRYIRKKQKE